MSQKDSNKYFFRWGVGGEENKDEGYVHGLQTILIEFKVKGLLLKKEIDCYHPCERCDCSVVVAMHTILCQYKT